MRKSALVLPALATHALIACAVACSACNERTRPWDQGDAAPPVETGAALLPPPLARLPDAGANAEDAGKDEEDAGEEDPAAAELPAPVKVGGPWVSCYGGFHPSGDPLKDVTRLSLLCGPANGMRRLSKETFKGAIDKGGAPASTSFEAKQGACYRVFAVAELSVGDLDLTVRSSRGAPIAADHGEDVWPIVQPDRPFCPLENDRYTLEVSSARGSGRFAAEVWILPAPGR